MRDHYKTLRIRFSATQEEVRKAFREQAKKYHPDRHSERTLWATAMMKRLIEARRVLSSSTLRRSYDEEYRIRFGLDRAVTEHRRGHYTPTPPTQAEKVLDLLMTGKEVQAMALYERLQSETPGYDLAEHLDTRDWIDCKFLIAEQYEHMAEPLKALHLYEALYHSDDANDRFSDFMHEVRERLLRLYCRELAPAADTASAVQYYLHALPLVRGRSRRSFLHKKLAECHLELENRAEARRQLAIAFELKPDLKGASKICRNLAFVQESV